MISLCDSNLGFLEPGFEWKANGTRVCRACPRWPLRWSGVSVAEKSSKFAKHASSHYPSLSGDQASRGGPQEEGGDAGGGGGSPLPPGWRCFSLHPQCPLKHPGSPSARSFPRKQKPFPAESFSERKGLLSQMSRKRPGPGRAI